ncbi:TnsA endonuclease C-terminal domain-containing protein [Alicyclobacillus mengziensis]|uniref:Heteromeric transposase endonuclease subunit TnsA n=1 Tax=Alicyclobacillus mengziensis TaxID=2931921 RepID=A0A9X7W399_9BACL|nr:TnsA endonuclease C-terminal domain-containing protein [Alicyclobacillus mengziensis]QSO48503.1 heteromeric transposase endonuclease subunit TnsA [Alicyclobacillus mengziensis]
MAKQPWTEEKMNKWLKEGRGQGTEKSYIPWVKISDFPSIGRATRIFGVKIPRIYHLQSDNQLRCFLLFEWSALPSENEMDSPTTVVDIRESFPLLNMLETIDDKDDLRMDKFTDKETGVPMVLVTNFLLTVRDANGKETFMARSVKNASELRQSSAFENLEIQRRYWRAKGVEWKLITDKQIPKQFSKNVSWVRETLLDDGMDSNEKSEQALLLHHDLLRYPDLKLVDVLNAFDYREGVSQGIGLYLLRYLIAKKRIHIDMNQSVQIARKVRDVLQ